MKLDKQTVAKRYAKALYALAEQEQQVEAIYEEVKAVQTIFNDNPQLGTALVGNALSMLKKRQLVDQLIAPFSQMMQNFINLVFDYQRMVDMPNIMTAFNHLYNEKNQITKAKVTSTVKLTEEQKKRLADAYAKRFEVKTVVIENVIDPSILGGLIVEANHKVIDGSVQHGLQQIKKALLLK